ncbi:MAG TPA: tetratricopeptide repeat protein, partial [Thermoanaerobaculia bacterium]|nr:tetratricopeptide repeat protein [Thermoanaerobaculia bacterium]
VDFPGSSNVHDSLGEAYLAAGDVDAAIRSYRKSLELDPANENARNVLKQLKAQ